MRSLKLFGPFILQLEMEILQFVKKFSDNNGRKMKQISEFLGVDAVTDR